MTTYNTATLPNGLRVIHLDAASPVVYMGYQIAAGSRNEAPGEEGLAHLLEHMTFKGTRRRSALRVISTLERVGGDLNAFTTKETTTYHAAILGEHAALAVDLLSDIVFRSQYPDDELEREKAVVGDEIESYRDTPADLIFDEFENQLFVGHPLGHNILGTKERVASFESHHLRRFAQRWYRPDNAVFFAYGHADFGRLLRTLERATADIPRPTAPLGSPTAGAAGADALGSTWATGPIVLTHHTHQAHVMTGSRAYRHDDPRRMALVVLNNLLGGPAMSSRLNLSLRERHGLVYTVDSSLLTYADTGTWAIYYGCDHRDVGRCQRLVARELARLAATPLSPRQLQAAKRQLKGQIGIAADSREQFALDFGKSYLLGGRERHLDQLFADIDAVTAEQMADVARNLFAPDRLLTLTIE